MINIGNKNDKIKILLSERFEHVIVALSNERIVISINFEFGVFFN